jgi:AmmeMemoRadiSam system protein B/AmmeMemoRadiSam system protein A
MNNKTKIQSWFWILLFIFLAGSGCRSQVSKTLPPLTDRPAAAAGSFYPSDPVELRMLLADMFSQAKVSSSKNVIALICPHAGYEFSGVVAASSYRQLDPGKQYENIFIIGSSHHVAFMGASIYNTGDYQTPLGKVKVNRDLANKLIKENVVFSFRADADRDEHSIEVQIPFLQYYLKKSFTLVPIILGTQSADVCRKIAVALKPYMNGNNLFVISTDFSHYPPYDDAIAVDKKTCDAILSNHPDRLLNVLKENENRNVTNLATSLCGWTSVMTLLYMTEGDPAVSMTPVYYRNSGDSKYQDKKQVVGYWSILVSKKEKERQKPAPSGFNLNDKDKKDLLMIARTTLREYILNQKTPEINTAGFSKSLMSPSGAFVTLKEEGALRGCVGRFIVEEPLWKVVQQMAIASSTQDNRFPPVDPKEIGKISIEISVLSPMRRIKSPDEIELGKHGIYITKGYYSGTFLPQVATETGWSKEDFIGHCSRDKAGLGWDGWKNADLYIYEAAVFSEEEINGHKE